jgi:hypothetical protein
METVTTRPFEFEGRKYEIRVVLSDRRYRVPAFLDDKRADGFEYSCDVFTDAAIQSSIFDMHGFEHLMNIAESDVRNEIWEQYVAAVRASMPNQPVP